jgi:predicted alpha-1,2-mannosidase
MSCIVLHISADVVYSLTNAAPDWTVYFCGKFDQSPTSAQTFLGTDQNIQQYGKSASVSGTQRLGAVFSFNNTLVTSRSAVSYVSTQQACQYLDNEIPAGTTLTGLVNASKARWNSEVFAKITTTDTNNTGLTQLYTSLYGMHLLPSNRTGDNPRWQSTEPYYDDIVTFWDLFRCTTALFHIIQPTFYEELLRSIIDIWRNEGWTPDARGSDFTGRTQGGTNTDNILADAFVKGVQGKVNWEDAYAAMQTNAEKVPPNNNDPSSPDSSTKQGRGALPDWLQYGFITPTFNRAVTRAVEYAGNDFGLHQIAKGLNKTDDSIKYLKRSRNWRNHWDPNAESFGTKGFMVPRLANGSYIKTDPMSCGGCYWKDAYYEGKPWEYSVNAHHDMQQLINLSGGPVNFTQRLQTLMDPAKKIFNPGNEPSFATPYLYNYAGRQDLSVMQSRRVADTQYNSGPGGLPGASDAGAMQSWILWNMIGLYPITGQTTFLIGSPWFKDMTIQLGGGNTVKMTAIGGNGTSIYVQSLKVNGQPWTQNWLSWSDIFATGGTMDFVLGPNPVKWDTGDLPPSPATRSAAAGDNGGPAKVTKPGPQVIGKTPIEPAHRKMDHKVKVAAIVLSILGFVTIVSGAALLFWLRRIGVLGRKKQTAPVDPESASTTSAHAADKSKTSDGKLKVVEVNDSTNDSSSERIPGANSIDPSITQPSPVLNRLKFWRRRNGATTNI